MEENRRGPPGYSLVIELIATAETNKEQNAADNQYEWELSSCNFRRARAAENSCGSIQLELKRPQIGLWEYWNLQKQKGNSKEDSIR